MAFGRFILEMEVLAIRLTPYAHSFGPAFSMQVPSTGFVG